MALKIPQLLIQYLYKNRKMPLPGLGIFTLDKSVVLPEENDRVLLSMPNAVQFQNANIIAADKELISFICEHTGKIRPLAISDLDSYLNLGYEMLNIGKPFHLEGIGIITKNKNGKFDFQPGEYTLIRENAGQDNHGKKSHYAKDKKQGNTTPVLQNRNLLKWLALVAAVAIVGWGGWLMYKKNATAINEPAAVTSAQVQEPQAAKKDSLQNDSTRSDSGKIPSPNARQPLSTGNESMNYKWVILATTNKPHALRRYNQLASFDLKVHLYQKDSTFFKVYFQFPSLVKDTIKIKDSLRRQYAHTVRIEQ